MSAEAFRVGLYDDPVFRAHDAGAGHPERPERLEGCRRGLQAAGLERRLVPIAPREATREELLRVHTPAHVDAVAATAGRRLRFDADTQAGPDSYAAALKAAGAVTDAALRVLAGELDRALCLVRPPGHHAEADRAMGFCLFNNVAVAAAAALAEGLERVAILDIDVHHGNGTQHVFERQPRVLYVSSHAWPFYPGTGAAWEVGEGAGEGFTVNLPLPSGTGDDGYARVYREIVERVGRAFEPELVIVSAGFDTWGGDPLAGMELTAAGFAELAAVCVAVAEPAAKRRVVFALEGGYSLEGLAAGTAAIARAALGEPHAPLALPPGRGEALLATYREALAPYWGHVLS